MAVQILPPAAAAPAAPLQKQLVFCEPVPLRASGVRAPLAEALTVWMLGFQRYSSRLVADDFTLHLS